MRSPGHSAVLLVLATSCGVPPAAPALRHAATLSFGAVAVGSSANQRLEFENTSGAPVVVAASVDDGPFTLAQAGVRLEGHSRGALEVRLAPAALGPVERALHLRVGDVTSDVNLTGAGAGPALWAPGALSFGLVPLVAGSPDDVHAILTIRNAGTSGATLHVQTPLVDGTEVCPGDWVGASCFPVPPATLEAGASAEIPLVLRPSSAGARQWTLTLASDDPVQPVRTVTLFAAVEPAAPCDLDVQPTQLDLRANGGVVTARHRGPGRCYLRDARLTSTPDGALSLDALPPMPVAIEPGASLSVGVRVAPLAPPDTTGTLHLLAAGGADTTVPIRVEPRLCLVVAPSDFDFGSVRRGCNSAVRSVQLYNVCSQPIEVRSVSMLAAAGQPAGGPDCPGSLPCPEFHLVGTPVLPALLQPASAPQQFQVKYLPIDVGADTGAVRLQTSEGEYLVTLRGYVDSQPAVVTDGFMQAPLSPADVLVLVDASPSFVPKRAALRDSMVQLLGMFSGLCVDGRVAFAAAEGAPSGGRTLLTSDGGQAWFSTRQPGFVSEALAAFDTLPVGSETEACLAPASELLRSPDAGVRRGTNFSGICITDALEQTPDAGEVWDDLVTFTRDAGISGWLSWSTVTGVPGSTCSVEGVDDGTHLALANAGHGVREDICNANWWNAFQPFDTGWCGLRTQFFLNVRPGFVAVIEVRVDGAVVAPVDAQGQVVWTYDAVIQAVVFAAGHVPPHGAFVEISYEPGCW